MNDNESGTGTVDARSVVIEGWMRMVLRTGAIERFDDLHIDQIDSEWKRRKAWCSGSSEAIKLAREICNRIAPDKVLALMCSLTGESGETLPESIEDLAAQIDWSPPSLYLFDRGSEPWSMSSEVRVTPLNEIFTGCTCLLMQYVVVDEPVPRRSFVAIT